MVVTSGEQLTDDELAAIGVKREPSRYDGEFVYVVPCDICGRQIKMLYYSTNKTYKCRMCADSVLEKRHAKQKLAQEQYELEMSEEIGVDLAHYRRFERGVRKFGLEYYPAIAEAEKIRYKFDSVSEVVACIELLHRGFSVIPHQKVGSFTVDFCLPVEKVVLEIDGSIYHANADKEQRRDIALKNMLGSDWVIRHIPADLVTKNHKAFGKIVKRMLDDRRFELNIK